LRIEDLDDDKDGFYTAFFVELSRRGFYPENFNINRLDGSVEIIVDLKNDEQIYVSFKLDTTNWNDIKDAAERSARMLADRVIWGAQKELNKGLDNV
jgi:hypothetical protein